MTRAHLRLAGFLAALCAAAALVTGCRPQVRASGRDELVLGFTVSQTGKLNVPSTGQTRGLRLWMEHANRSGGVKLSDGRRLPVRAVTYDDESNTDRVQELYTRLATRDHADFLISPYSSGLTAAAAVIAEQNGKVMLTTGAAADSTYQQGYRLIYQVYTPASRYLTGAVDLLGTLEATGKRLAFIYENAEFSTTVVEAAVAYARRQGYEVVLHEGYDRETTDFGPFLNKLRRAAPDAVLGGGHFQDGSTFARQLHEKKQAVKLLVLLVAPPEPAFADLGEAALGVVGPSQWEPQAAFTAEGAVAAGLDWCGLSAGKFVEAYREAYGEEPSYHAAGGYATGLILQRAIEEAGTVETHSVSAALDALDLQTFFGHTKFETKPQSHGLQTGHSMLYVQWQRGATGELTKQVIWPKEAATAAPVQAKRATRADWRAGGNGPAAHRSLGAFLLASLTDGLLLGFVYGLAAMGLTLIWGVMRVINLSHGPLITLGMFSMYFLFTGATRLNPYVALLLLAPVALLLGVGIYYVAVHRVIDAPHLSTLLATYAVNMILLGIGTAVFSASPRNAQFDLGALTLGPVTVQVTRVIAAVAALVVTGGLYAFLYRTRPGRYVRAVANNRAAAELMGVPSARILALSFGLGTMLAAVSGALIATFFPFTVYSGGVYELKSFVIAVLGGLGNPVGALYGGLLLGVVEGVLPVFMQTTWVPVIEFVLFVLVLLFRPAGLFGGRE